MVHKVYYAEARSRWLKLVHLPIRTHDSLPRDAIFFHPAENRNDFDSTTHTHNL